MMKNEYQSVGIIIIARDTNRFLVLHRTGDPKTWAALAGGMEDGENPLETIKREIMEEIGINPNMIDGIKEVGKTNTMGPNHYVMIGFVDREFDIPNLKLDENDDYGWFTDKTLPKPIHPGWDEAFQYVKPYLDLREYFKKGFNMLMRLEEQEDDLGWAKDLISQLRYHEDKHSKGYFNAENKKMGYWEFYDNGKLYSKGEFINGEKTGSWEYYHSNGKLWEKGEYINNQRNGPWEIYYGNGKLYSKGEFINDQRTGPWEYYYSNGKLHSKGEFINDKETGPWEFYHSNGELDEIVEY